MKELIPINEHGIFVDTRRRVWANSLHVAKYFHKRHKNVLRDINAFSLSNSGVSKEFSRLNFEPSNYTDTRGKTQPVVNMTRDGFTLLVMGYTGKKAMEYKEFYISRFNQLEKWVAEQQLALVAHKPVRRTMTDAIRDNIPPEKQHPYTYSNFTRLAYKAAGVPLKLPQMDAEQIEAVQKKEHAIAVLLDAGIIDYGTLKTVLAGKAVEP